MEEELQYVSSLFSSPTALHHGACALVYHAVCAEALRVVLALRCLAQPGLAELGDVLQGCRLDLSVTWDADAPLRAAEPPLPDAPHFSIAGSSAPPPLASAQATIERASLHGLLTAAHLLRCSSWTAASLVSIASPEAEADHGQPRPYSVMTTSAASPPPPPSLRRDARVVEALRTREGGWCATALVSFTEWLLPQVRFRASASCDAALLSHALSVIDDNVPGTAALASSSADAYGSCREGDVSSWRWPSSSRLALPRSRRAAVVVADPLPLHFPAVAHGHPAPYDVSVSTSRDVAVGQPVTCGCGHRWLCDDLPRWCIGVALAEQAALWCREARLRHALAQWRARRGLRVVARLSRAAEVMALDRSRDAALAGDARAVAPEAAPEVAFATAAAPTDARVPNYCPPPLVPTGSHEAPSSSWGFRDVSAADVSAIASDGAAPPSVQSQELPRISFPADSLASQPRVPQLDSVLGGCASKAAKAQVSTTSSGVAEESARTLERQDPPSALATAARPARSSHVSRDQVAAPERTSPGISDIRTPVLQQLSAASVPPAPSNAHDTPHDAHQPEQPQQTHEEDAVRLLRHRRATATLRAAFLWWRDRRLYEALAVRFMEAQRREARRARCWGQWKRRRAAVLQREKEARDVARSDVFTEEKALQYFRGLLQRWRTAAVVRRFRITTVGHRVLRTWACHARLAQAQRARLALPHRQRPPLPHVPQLIGGKRLLVQAWAQWRARHAASVADRHWARSCAAATLRRMRAVRSERQACHAADTHQRLALLGRALQQWTRQYNLRVRVQAFAVSRSAQGALLRSPWRTWQVRLARRQRQRADTACVRAFRVAHVAGGCLAHWLQRWRAEVQLRRLVARQQRRFLLRPVLARWQQRTSVRLVVRHGQDELADKLQEQLQERRVLRTWRRRAAEHAGRRSEARAAHIEEDADRVLRLNRLARAFFHWRTREQLRRRYNVDRRRLRGTAELLRGAATMPDGTQRGGGGLGADLASPLTSDVMDPLPPSPRTSMSHSRQRRRHSPRVSPARPRDARGAATAAPAAARSTRLVPVAQADVPLRHRRLAQHRQLLLVSAQEATHALTLSQSRVSLVRVQAAPWHLTAATAPPPAPPTYMPPTHTKSAVSRTPAPLPRCPTRGTFSGAPRPSRGSRPTAEHLDPSDGTTPWRSRTATPLFTPDAPVSPVASPPRRFTTTQLSGGAALVDSPHPPSPALRPRGAASRFTDNATSAAGPGLISEPTPAASVAAGRLLGHMERLLGRIRTMEQGYRAPPATAVAASSSRPRM